MSIIFLSQAPGLSIVTTVTFASAAWPSIRVRRVSQALAVTSVLYAVIQVGKDSRVWNKIWELKFQAYSRVLKSEQNCCS